MIAARRHVAVIGAGASGTFQALHLLREGVERVTLVEREREPGRGTAYGTRRPEHLLNVTARRMSVFPDDPDHFARWFGRRGGAAEDFAQRKLFGDYVCELMDAALADGDRLEIIRGEAVDVVVDGAEVVQLADGGKVEADAVVLAMGNLRPATPPGLDPGKLGAFYVDDPWYGGFRTGLEDGDAVLLVGTALTAIDAALTLDALGFRGPIHAISRRGLVPRPHLTREPVASPLTIFPPNVVTLLRGVRRRADEIGWREAVHELRSVTQQLWAGAPPDQKRRFIRHLRPWWDVHRHRIAPAVAERIAAMTEEGRLMVAAGRIRGAETDGDAAVVTWLPRGQAEVERLRVKRIVNCSGPELDIARSGDPLLSALLAAGRIRPDPCRLGVEVNAESRVVTVAGALSDSLYAIGPMTRGAFWESIAVSDIAVQAQTVAKRIADLDL